MVSSVPMPPDTYDVSLRGQSPRERYVRLPGGSGIGFSVSYRVLRTPGERTWMATASTYRYSIFDRDGHEVLSYHWHPNSHSHVTTPHLHLGCGVASWRLDLSKAHIPTGMVTLEAVLLLTIEELALDIEPLRADWRGILTRAHDIAPQRDSPGGRRRFLLDFMTIPASRMMRRQMGQLSNTRHVRGISAGRVPGACCRALPARRAWSLDLPTLRLGRNRHVGNDRLDRPHRDVLSACEPVRVGHFW